VAWPRGSRQCSACVEPAVACCRMQPSTLLGGEAAARQQQRTSFMNAITIPPFQDHASLAMHLHTANPKWPRQPAVTSAVWRSLIPLHHSSCTVFRPPAAPRPSADTQRGGLRRGLAGEVVGRDGAGAAVHDAGGRVPAELDGARVVAWSGLGLGLGYVRQEQPGDSDLGRRSGRCSGRSTVAARRECPCTLSSRGCGSSLYSRARQVARVHSFIRHARPTNKLPLQARVLRKGRHGPDRLRLDGTRVRGADN